MTKKNPFGYGKITKGKKEKVIEYVEKYSKPIGYKNDVPILRAYPRFDWPDGLMVFCKYCLSWHLHGGNGGSIKPEHRMAHCTNDPLTPYSYSGYYLQVVEDDKK